MLLADQGEESVTRKHPQNGPSLTKGKADKHKPMEHDRKAGMDAQAALDAAKTREFLTLMNNDPKAWIAKYYRGRRG
jgi:hypothetical protein